MVAKLNFQYLIYQRVIFTKSYLILFIFNFIFKFNLISLLWLFTPGFFDE